MLPPDMRHPKQGRRKLDFAATIMLFIAGTVLLAAGVGHALATGAKSYGFVDGSAEWTDALMSLFYILAASECFTANITVWAGEVLRGLGQRIAGGNITIQRDD